MNTIEGVKEFDYIKINGQWHEVKNGSIARMTHAEARRKNDAIQMRDTEKETAGWAEPTGINPHIKGHKKVTGKTW